MYIIIHNKKREKKKLAPVASKSLLQQFGERNLLFDKYLRLHMREKPMGKIFSKTNPLAQPVKVIFMQFLSLAC